MDAERKRLIIRPGDIVLSGEFVLEFPDGAPSAFVRTRDPDRGAWFERDPKLPGVICLTTRGKSV